MTQAAMNNGIVLYELGVERSQVEAFRQLVYLTPELFQVLQSPVVDLQKKYHLIDQVFSGTDQPEVLVRFLKVMCRNEMVVELEDIFRAYEQYWDQLHKIKRVHCIYAAAPSEKELDRVKTFLKGRYPDVTLDYKIEIRPKILGGVIIRVGHEEYDWSYEGRLRELEQAIRA